VSKCGSPPYNKSDWAAFAHPANPVQPGQFPDNPRNSGILDLSGNLRCPALILSQIHMPLQRLPLNSLLIQEQGILRRKTGNNADYRAHDDGTDLAEARMAIAKI
jgi:hypothetical protein